MREDTVRKGKRIHIIRRALLGALLIIVPLLFLTGRTISSFDRSVIRSYGNPEAEAPDIKAESASLYSLDMQRHVYEKNGDKKMDPYSITKILTCYLILENEDLNKKVRITEDKYLDYTDGSHMMALKGEIFTVDDLLKATMLSSANDAAYFLAVTAAGSEKKFADMMNKQVKEWGCENTHFVNPNGWKNKKHYTTAHDMAIITAKCFESEGLRKLSDIREYTIAATDLTEQRDYVNFFWMAVEKNRNVLWGKTGSWSEDDCSIVLGFSEDNLNEVMVLLGDSMEKRISDIEKLQDFSHRVTPGYIVAGKGDVVCAADVSGGAETETGLCFDKIVFVYPKNGQKSEIKVAIDVDELEAPLKKGQKAGKYTVIVNDKEVDKGKLLASRNVKKGWILSRFYISDKESMVLGVFILVIAALEIILARRKSQ